MRRAPLDTESGFIIILSIGKLRRRTYCMPQREAMYKESTATGATSRCSLLVPCPRINCIADALLRSRHNTPVLEGARGTRLADSSGSRDSPPAKST